MPKDLKLSQIGSSPLPPPFRGLHYTGVRKHCQIIFACYFRKSSIMWWPCFKFTSGFWEQVLLLCTPSVLLLLTLNTSIQHKPTHWRKMNHLLCSCFKCLAKSMHACIVVYTVLSLVVQWHTITCLLIIWTQMQVVTCFIFIFLQYVTYIIQFLISGITGHF